jgi:F0F1-type ATP synthase membrane subunit b/b'
LPAVNVFLPFPEATSMALASAPQAPEAQLLDLDGSVFIMLGIFLVLLLILWQLLWKPYLHVRDERVARTDGRRAQAAELENEAAARLARIEAALAEARKSGNAEMAKLRGEAQAKEQQTIAESQEAVRTMLAEARAKLDTSVAAERANLQAETDLLAHQIAEKALGRRLVS